MKLYYCHCPKNSKYNNFGDAISAVVVRYVWGSVEVVDREYKGKMLAIGSLLQRALRENDIVWGAGLIKDIKIESPKGVKWLSVRGSLTRERISGADIPEIYGDPALIISDIYNPEIKKKHKVGGVPHYIDDREGWNSFYKISLLDKWQNVIDNVKSCDLILSSSLHGLVVAEAYGIPAVWIKPTDKIGGGEFKFQDYFLGTDRTEQTPSDFDSWNVLPEIDLDKIKKRIYESSNNGGRAR